MRLVICDGVQYDADNLPAGVDAAKCVPADEWFRVNSSRYVPPEPSAPKPKRTRGK